MGKEFTFNLELVSVEFLTFKLLPHLLKFIIIRGIRLIQTTGERVIDGWRGKRVLVDVQLLMVASSILKRRILLRIYHLTLANRPAVKDNLLV